MRTGEVYDPTQMTNSVGMKPTIGAHESRNYIIHKKDPTALVCNEDGDYQLYVRKEKGGELPKPKWSEGINLGTTFHYENADTAKQVLVTLREAKKSKLG